MYEAGRYLPVSVYKMCKYATCVVMVYMYILGLMVILRLLKCCFSGHF